MKYRFIASHTNRLAVRSMCRVLGVPVSGYYGWTQQTESKWSKENRKLIGASGKYTKSIMKSMEALELPKYYRIEATGCSRVRTARLMRTTKLRAKTVRKLRVTTDSNHKEPVTENLLSQNFRVVVPNDVWVSDISYIRTGRGWQYLTSGSVQS